MAVYLSVLALQRTGDLSPYGSWDRLQHSYDPKLDKRKRMGGWIFKVCFQTGFSKCIILYVNMAFSSLFFLLFP